MRLQQQKRRRYKAKASAKAFEEKVYDQLAAKKQKAQTLHQKMLVDTCINEIKKDLQCFRSSGHAKYPFSPRKSISVEEDFIISSPKQRTASGCVKHKGVEKPSKKNRTPTLVLSQRARNAIVTTMIRARINQLGPFKETSTRIMPSASHHAVTNCLIPTLNDAEQ